MTLLEVILLTLTFGFFLSGYHLGYSRALKKYGHTLANDAEVIARARKEMGR